MTIIRWVVLTFILVLLLTSLFNLSALAASTPAELLTIRKALYRVIFRVTAALLLTIIFWSQS